uniref:Calcineurin-like phosphoesterase domain containing 1 n=1 Tax=Neogobius melanostomus TaxID=47308 RepID=A0A8C6S8U8_9GOBI
MRKRISRRSTGYCLSEGRLINFKEKAYAEGHWRAPSVHPGRGPAAGADEGVASGRLRRRRRRMGRRSGADQRAVEAVNRLQPRPRFMVLCGDLVHAMPGSPFREEQERALKTALKGTDSSIPLVFVSGNHDLDDYFSFWVGGVLCLVLNSQLFFDASACPQLKEAQETWLEEQLSRATEQKPKHVLVFQHIPLYLKTPNEDDNYFNLQGAVRQQLMDRFKRAGVKAVFSGHYHRNAGGCHDGLDMVVSSAIGCQLGEDAHGLRVVAVTERGIVHRYFSLEQLRTKGMDEDLKKLLEG